MKKQIASTIIILLFGTVITITAITTKNTGTDVRNKVDSETVTEAVVDIANVLDTENTEISDADQNSSDSSKDKSDYANNNEKKSKNLNNDSKGLYETDIIKNDESGIADNADKKYSRDKDLGSNNSGTDTNKANKKTKKDSRVNDLNRSNSGTNSNKSDKKNNKASGDNGSDSDNSGTDGNNDKKSDNGVIELPIIPID